MKEQQPKQMVGVWMDHRNAIFISNANGEFAIHEKVKADEYHGDKGEHAAMNAEKADNRKYYKAISHLLVNYDDIFIFGPGKSQEELRNFLHEDQHYKSKRIALATAEHITDHQMVAKVRDHFKE
jgi:hypothetical protein